jgi:hypothetical protein
MTDIEQQQCSVCQCEFTYDEGGVDGYFGILPVRFCPTCFSCMCDMACQWMDIDPDEGNEEHEELIDALRGYQDIVINTQHGGFGLSYEAAVMYLEQSQIPYTLTERNDRNSTQVYGPQIIVNGQAWSDRDVDRSDPVLVRVVQELGDQANTRFATLKIVRIPADVDWSIEEYDGREWVAEVHRTWD